MRSYFDQTITILKESVDSMDTGVLARLSEDCVRTISNGGKVVVSGLGKNVPVCDKFVGTMLSLGLNAGFMHTNSAVHGDLGLVRDGDLVIVLTKSGETVESIYLVEQLKKRKVEIWLLSFTSKSTLTEALGENCLILDLQHEGDLWNIAPSNSTTVNLIVLQGLAWSIAKEMNCSLDNFRMNHPGGHIGDILK